MLINDRVYGKEMIYDKVLQELIVSAPLQRIKKINQAGSSKYVCSGKDITRYEHCIGVMILLRRLGTDIKEQIAGLLHDVPHTAFSHVIDFVFKSKEHDYHEGFMEKIVMNSEIPEILKRHDIDVGEILDEKNFPILERKLPDLCADRVDYTLRDSKAFGTNPTKTGSFIVHDNEIIMKDFKSAQTFGNQYLDADERSWSHPREVASFQVMADAISIALENKILTEDDLFTDDDTVFEILKNSGNEKILDKIAVLTPDFSVVEDEKDYDWRVFNKVRYIDPKYIEDDQILRLSETDEIYKKRLEEHNDRFSKGLFLRVLNKVS